MSLSKIRIFVAEDHPIVCEGLRRLAERRFDWELVGFSSGATGALDACRFLKPDIFLADLSLSEGSGLDLISGVHKISGEIRILVMSLYAEDEFAFRTFQLGASGYVMKSRGLEAVEEGVRLVAEGGLYFSPAILARIQKERRSIRKPVAEQLTPREIQIFQLVGQGLTAKSIAAELGISVRTVEAHRENIKNKLNLHSRLELNQRAHTWVREIQRKPDRHGQDPRADSA